MLNDIVIGEKSSILIECHVLINQKNDPMKDQMNNHVELTLINFVIINEWMVRAIDLSN